MCGGRGGGGLQGTHSAPLFDLLCFAFAIDFIQLTQPLTCTPLTPPFSYPPAVSFTGPRGCLLRSFAKVSTDPRGGRPRCALKLRLAWFKFAAECRWR